MFRAEYGAPHSMSYRIARDSLEVQYGHAQVDLGRRRWWRQDVTKFDAARSKCSHEEVVEEQHGGCRA